MYIAFEGIVGVGKSTQAEMLATYLTEKYPKREVLLTREPGGDEIAEKIRVLVQGTNFNVDMKAVCEAYLYAAARAQSLRTIVQPCLRRGGIVIVDRSIATSLVYQGIMRGVGINKIMRINKEALAGCLPNYVLLLDMPVAAALPRVHDLAGDKWESKGSEFFRHARRGYRKVEIYWRLRNYMSGWKTIDAQGTKDEVFELILTSLNMRK